MDAVLRGFAVYFFLLVLFRISGKRSMAQITTFDFILLLIISETTQQALLVDDFSITNAFILIITLVVIDMTLAMLKERLPWLDKAVDSVPLVILEDGKPIEERMNKVRVDVSDILAAAREKQGLQRLDQIKYAVLERSGGISIIPKE